jgi:hypothetical protein
MSRRLPPLVALIVFLLLAALAPAGAAAAETRTFLNTDHEFPTGDANGLFGPASHYPSTIVVSGVAGTVTNVTATVVGLSSASGDDIDMALVGPNEEQVMLMSDACGVNPNTLSEKTWTFDDAAQEFLSDPGSCPAAQVASFKPSNYENPELDSLSKEGGGPPPPYTNSMSDLAGGSPNGSWELFVLDDNKTGFVGFSFGAWALNLEIEPPPPPAPTVVTVTVPGPSTGSPAPTAHPAKTGKRAAALAKCKMKKTAKKRAKCRAKAQKLPV